MSGVISRLSAMLKGGKISVKELIEAYISRIEAVNPLLNAYVYTTFEEALSKADVLQKRIAEGRDTVRAQRQYLHSGHSDYLLFKDTRKFPPLLRRDRLVKVKGAGRRSAREDQYGRVCHGFHFRELLLRRAQKSREHGVRNGRFFGRFGRGGQGRACRMCARLGYGRLYKTARLLLRSGRF